MDFGSLFAGIGGIDLGLERAGMNCVWQVEIDQYCQRVLEKHWPNVERYGDIGEVGVHNLEAVDLVAGGFPCQPHSSAGKKSGTEDHRWLWPEFARVIRELEPRWVLVENVTGLRAVNDGRAMGEVLRDLAQSGYDAEWQMLPAVAFGALHQRDRLFLVAHATGTRYGRSGTSQPECQRQEVGWGQHTRGDGRDRVLAGSVTRLPTWGAQPAIRRVADGVPDRMDRIRTLGNAVVPQVAEWIGRKILWIEEGDDEKGSDGT